MTYFPEINIINKGSSLYDGVGRMRTSESSPLLALQYVQDKQPLLVDEIVNGTATSIKTGSTIVISTSANGDYAIRQSKTKAYYTPGNTQSIKFTMDNFGVQSNIVKRRGYFSSSTVAPYTASFDGIWLSSESGAIYVNVGNNGTVDSVAQSAWNIDKLDGTGPSGITIDWDKSQLILVDFLWLGVASVKWGIYHDDQVIFFHEQKHANLIDGTYMLSPNQYLRTEIRQTGAGSGSVTEICSSVTSEGGNRPLKTNFATSFEAVGVNGASVDYVMKSIRFQSGKDCDIDISNISAISTGNDNYEVSLWLNPTFSGTLTYSAVANSSIEVANGSGLQTIISGTKIYSSFSLQTNSQQNIQPQQIKLGTSINGTRDTIMLVVRPLTATATFSGSLSWKESI